MLPTKTWCIAVLATAIREKVRLAIPPSGHELPAGIATAELMMALPQGSRKGAKTGDAAYAAVAR